MDGKELFDTVRRVLTERLGVDADEVTPGTRLVADLGVDSLEAVELMIEFESQFDIIIDDRDAEQLQTVQQLTDYLAKRLEEKNVKKAE
jgi:acyl carrier protein